MTAPIEAMSTTRDIVNKRGTSAQNAQPDATVASVVG
jgi:hypothetical protein